MEYQEHGLRNHEIANNAIDISQFRDIFRAQKMVLIENFCTPEFAGLLHQHFNDMPSENWYVSTYPESVKHVRPKHTLNVPSNAAFIRHFRSVANAQFSKGDYAFRFKRTRYPNNLPEPGPELTLYQYFNSRAFLDVLEEVIDAQLESMNGSFASCYERGDFLARHNDANNGVVGFVLYLSKNWQPDWGGEIEFMNRETLETHTSLLPSFNKLLIFSINELKDLQHEVKMISDNANEKRLAYSGWFR